MRPFAASLGGDQVVERVVLCTNISQVGVLARRYIKIQILKFAEVIHVILEHTASVFACV